MFNAHYGALDLLPTAEELAELESLFTSTIERELAYLDRELDTITELNNPYDIM